MKNFKKKIIDIVTSPALVGLIVTIAITYAAAIYYSKRADIHGKDQSLAGFIQQLNEKTIDWRLSDRGFKPGFDSVAILAVDNESIDIEGRWPWTRAKQAKLIDKTLMYGAKSISFDIIHSEESDEVAIPALERVRRSLEGKDPNTDKVKDLIELEKAKADSDHIFANTIRAGAKQLILGTFDTGSLDHVPGYVELCLDARFERTFESRYWASEALPLTVEDQAFKELKYPKDLKEHLGKYFYQLESNAASEWMSKVSDLNDRIKDALGDLGTGVVPEVYSGIAALVIHDDVDTALKTLPSLNPNIKTRDDIRRFFSAFGRAFSRQEWAALKSAIAEPTFEYCQHMWGANDELADKKTYLQIWGDTPDSKKDFDDTLSWDAFFFNEPPDADGKHEDYKDAIPRIIREALPSDIPEVSGWVVNIPLFGDAKMHSGYFSVVQDVDGSIRHSPLVKRHGNAYFPSLAFKTFLVTQGYNGVLKIGTERMGDNKSHKVISGIDINDNKGTTIMSVPVDHSGYILIDYSGPAYMFPHVRASDILTDSPTMRVTWKKYDPTKGRFLEAADMVVNKRDFLKDKVLIAGITAVGVFDMRVTPFDENYPGVETHANVLSNLLAEDARARGEQIDPKIPGFLRASDLEARYMWIVLLALGLSLSMLLSYFGSLIGLGITALALFGVYVVDKYYLFNRGIVIAVLFPVILITVTFVAMTFYKYFTEERKKRALKGTFEKYVSPAIVAEVLADPENIELGGKKMELTVMFSDVRGFTTISEKLDPRALSDLLNSYLTPMTNLVFEHKGTLDKYMGDAIMAFWGAPIHFKDHAKHACRCALHMIVKLKELQEAYRAQGLPEIDIGIGLNTGDMSVGNMGSDTVRSYTVMGDAVNLGSRLEGINKQYGTRIIISEFTFEEVKDSFICREVDWVRVKGKAQPVRIFELVAEGKVEAQKAELLKLFGEGFQLYHQMKFTEAIEIFQKALSVDATDPVSELYLERCQDYVKEPPPADWDGVFTMTSK